jgi:hypothetical protein
MGSFSGLTQQLASIVRTPADIARDEDYWAPIVRALTVDASTAHGLTPVERTPQSDVGQAACDHASTENRHPQARLWSILGARG